MEIDRARKITANELRALAEAADGTRGTPLCIVENSNAEPPYLVVDLEKATADGQTPILILETKDDPTTSVPRDRIKLATDRPLIFKGDAVDINQCDAVFTSLPAIEKFVIPYYARMRSIEQLAALHRSYAEHADVVAMVHLPGSVEDTATAGQIAALVAGPNDDRIVVRPLF